MEDRERIVRLETELSYIKNILEKINTKLDRQAEDLQKMKTETRLISAIVSGGLVLVWEFVRRKLGS